MEYKVKNKKWDRGFVFSSGGVSMVVMAFHIEMLHD